MRQQSRSNAKARGPIESAVDYELLKLKVSVCNNYGRTCAPGSLWPESKRICSKRGKCKTALTKVEL
jgi:hypothetical protein